MRGFWNWLVSWKTWVEDFEDVKCSLSAIEIPQAESATDHYCGFVGFDVDDRKEIGMEQTEKDRLDESNAMKAYWAELKANAAAGDADAVAKLEKDKEDESAGMKAYWENLKADAAAGKPEAVAKLAKIREDASVGSKEGWAKKKAEEAAE